MNLLQENPNPKAPLADPTMADCLIGAAMGVIVLLITVYAALS